MEDLSERLRQPIPRRICIIKPSSLGDIAHSLPILPSLRNLWPEAEIVWVVNEAFRSVIDGHPDLDRVVAYRRGASGLSTRGVLATSVLLSELAREPFDLTIDLQGLLRSGLMTAATRARVRVGMADAREGAGWFYTDTVAAPRREVHAVDRVFRVAQALGDTDPQPRFTVPVRQADRQWATESLAGVPRPRLVLNLGARWLTKRWPPEHFAEVARRAAVEFGAGLVAVGSSDDLPLVDSLRRHLAPHTLLDLSGRTTLLQLAAVAEQSDLFLSNDTGPLHLAAAVGAEVVGIYTCTNPRLTGPYGPRGTSVQSCVWCAPSFIRKCPRLECMSELTPDRVWPVVRMHLVQSLGSAA